MGGIKEIKAEIEAHRATGAFRYPPELREKVMRWVGAARERGMTCADIEASVDIKWMTLSRWSGSTGSSASAASPRTTELLPVEVVGDSALSLVNPSGYRIEGLSLSDAIAILRGIR